MKFWIGRWHRSDIPRFMANSRSWGQYLQRDDGISDEDILGVLECIHLRNSVGCCVSDKRLLATSKLRLGIFGGIKFRNSTLLCKRYLHQFVQRNIQETALREFSAYCTRDPSDAGATYFRKQSNPRFKRSKNTFSAFNCSSANISRGTLERCGASRGGGARSEFHEQLPLSSKKNCFQRFGKFWVGVFWAVIFCEFCVAFSASRTVRTKYGDVSGVIVTPDNRYLDAVEVSMRFHVSFPIT